MSQVFTLTASSTESDIEQAVSAAVNAVTNGGLVVIPTDTSYAIIADAFNVDAVKQLREAKGQSPTVPIPVGAATLATIEGIATLSNLARDLVSALWPSALTVLTKSQPSVTLAVGSIDSALATRIPNHPVALAVLGGIGPVAMTGAQLAGGSPVAHFDEVKAQLGDAITIYIDAGDLAGDYSSIVDTTGDYARLIRAGAVTLEQIRAVVPMVVDATASE